LFNAALWNNSQNADFGVIWHHINCWKDECFPTLKNRDGGDVNLSIDDLLNVEGSEYLLESFLWVSSDLLGVKWMPSLWNKRREPKYFMKEGVKPFNTQHVKEVLPRVLELNMAHHAHGVALSELREDKEANLETIIHYFQDALDRQPTNGHTMDRLARSYKDFADYLEKIKTPGDIEMEERIRILRMKSEYLIEMCSKVPDPHEDSLFSYALLLMKKNCIHCVNGGTPTPEEQEKLLEAERLFEAAIAKNHRHSQAMISDLRYFCLHRPIDSVLEHLKKVDGTSGCNVGFHAFVYLLLKREWERAAEIAHNIIAHLPANPDRRDAEILDFITQFKNILKECLQQSKQ